MVADGRGRALPDADLRDRQHRRELSRTPRRRRLLRPAGRRRGHERPDGLDARRHLHPAATDGATSRRPRSSWPSSPAPEAATSQTDRVGATGPYLVKGCTLPADVPPAVNDMLPYFDDGGQTSPALEFLSPVKGPALEQITVEVGSGIRPAADGAALYDEDVESRPSSSACRAGKRPAGVIGATGDCAVTTTSITASERAPGGAPARPAPRRARTRTGSSCRRPSSTACCSCCPRSRRSSSA